jgi:hypothetical protein
MKKSRIIAWISLSVAVLLIILGGISIITCKTYFGIGKVINIFHVANSFILVAIALFIATKQCCCDCNCECEGEEKKEK